MYEIRPNPTDGRAKASPDWPFPVGDLWFLRYRASEIDDGNSSVVSGVEAGLDGFVQGQSIDGTDVVVWYGAHFTHDQAGEEAGGHNHVVGPDLVPVAW
jgi:Cu2+-containing amine oxidase